MKGYVPKVGDWVRLAPWTPEDGAGALKEPWECARWYRVREVDLVRDSFRTEPPIVIGDVRPDAWVSAMWVKSVRRESPHEGYL